MNARRYEFAIAAVVVLFTAHAAHADSVRKLVEQGNARYAGQEFDAAAEKYNAALHARPDAPQIKYNKANAAYRQGDFGQAIGLYADAAAQSDDKALAAKAKYNLGNSYFKRGLEQQAEKPQQAVEDIRRGIEQWRDVQDMQPGHAAAARNIEVGRLVMKDLLEQIEKQKQQAQQQQQQQEQAKEQIEQLLQQQQDLAEETEQSQKDQQEGKQSAEQAAQKNEELAKKQSQLQEQTQQAAEQMKQQQPDGTPPPQQMHEAAEELAKALQPQKDAEEQLKQSKLPLAKDSQDKAAEQMQKALEKMAQKENASEQQASQDQGDQEQQEESAQQAEPEQSSEEQPPQQAQEVDAAEATVEDILQKEAKDRMNRRILVRGRQKVEKDW